MYMNKELNKYLNKLAQDGVFPGCNYLIMANDEIIKGSIGYKSLIPDKIANEYDNLYDIASLTKLVVTVPLISFLVRDGLISLDDYVNKYLEEFPYDDIKIIHLLTHSAGLKPTFDKFNLQNRNEFFEKTERIFEPGTNVKYIDVNFIILGFLIEKVYNKSLDLLANDLIFTPLEMFDTCYNPSNKEKCVPMELTKQRGLVVGTVHDEKAAFLGGVAGHAGVFSTVSDLNHFTEMILNNGLYKNKTFIEKNFIDMWFTPLFIGEDDIRRTVGWIYGKSARSCKEVCSSDTIIHTGFPGHHILIDRSNRLSIIFLSNRIHPNRDNDILLKLRKDINEYIYSLLKEHNKIYR